MSAAAGLDDLLDPLSRCLDPDSARRVVELQIPMAVQEGLDGFAVRANEGKLTEQERFEYEALINAADFISILKLKARAFLASNVP